MNRLLLAALVCSSPCLGQEPAPTEFQYPLGVVAAEDGTVYVADLRMPGIWQIKDGTRSPYFTASKKFRTPLTAVRCLALDQNGKLLAGCTSTREIYRFNDSNQPQPLTGGWIGVPTAIAVAADGTIYATDLELHRIWKFPSEGSKEPTEVAAINSPRGLTIDPDGNLWVLSTSSRDGQVQKISPDGKIESIIKDRPFELPHNIVRMDDGSFAVTDNYGHSVWKFVPGSAPEKLVSGSPLDRPVGLCLHGKNLLIADPHIKTIFSLAPDKSLTVFAAATKPAP